MSNSKKTHPDHVQGRTRGRRAGQCPCCRRETTLTFHHLIPRKLHRRVRFKRHYSRQQLALGIYVCRACHDGIHATYDEMTLAREFDSLSALQGDEALRRHFEWVGRQRVRTID